MSRINYSMPIQGPYADMKEIKEKALKKAKELYPNYKVVSFSVVHDSFNIELEPIFPIFGELGNDK